MKYLFFISLFIASCFVSNSQHNKQVSIVPVFNNAESIGGKPQNLQTPYNTAGSKLYMVGNQDGTFPDMGWHVKGEMGGIWHHPIKLLDGIEAVVTIDNKKYPLNKADSFVNFPFGNKHIYHTIPGKLSIERFQFVPDNMAAVYFEFSIRNDSRKMFKMNLDLRVISNLMPVWLGDRTGMVDGKDIAAFDNTRHCWTVKDTLNNWFTVYGSPLLGNPSKKIESKKGKPNTAVTTTNYTVEIKPGTVFVFPFIVAGSSKNKAEAFQQYEQVSKNAYELVSGKKERFRQLNENSKLTLDDKELETAYRWLKYNTDWLVVDVEGLGKGVCAGLPDYPWWFGGDIVYSLKGLIGTGRRDIVYSTIDLVHRVSEKNNGNGRIIHEVSTNGAVFNLGNVNETPQFASLIWDVFCWTGDMVFLHKYFPVIEKGLLWLVKENDADGNMLPDGNGMMEIHGLNSEMIDVATYTQKAFADAALMAKILGKDSLSKEYQNRADILKRKINADFWVEEAHSYADFIATKEQALQLTDDAIIRADTLNNSWAVSELKAIRMKTKADTSDARKGFVLHHNWVVNTPMETGIADKDKAIKALNTAQKFTNPFGMFVTGIDRNENSAVEERSYAKEAGSDFTYTGTVMTLPTGVQVVAENNYGRPGEAYRLLKKVAKTFSYALPGSMYEVSPDYGMMTQAWNIYAFGEPIIKQFFGIKPMAYKKEISISPMLPAEMANGKIEKVLIGDNEITVGFSQGAGSDKFHVSQKNDGWIIVFSQPTGKFKKWMLNNQTIKPQENGEWEQIKISGIENNIELVK